MSTATILTLRTALVASLVGSILVQVGILPAIWRDLETAPIAWRVAAVSILALWVVCLQVVAVCIWRLVSMAAAEASEQAIASASADRADRSTGTRIRLIDTGPPSGAIHTEHGAFIASRLASERRPVRLRR